MVVMIEKGLPHEVEDVKPRSAPDDFPKRKRWADSG
jgi:hypothetical protein